MTVQENLVSSPLDQGRIFRPDSLTCLLLTPIYGDFVCLCAGEYELEIRICGRFAIIVKSSRNGKRTEETAEFSEGFGS